MNESPGPTDWSVTRREKWRAQLGGMEAMLRPVDEPLIRALVLAERSRTRGRGRNDLLAAFDPEAAGPFRYGEVDRLLTLLDRAGFGDLGVNDWRGMLPVGGGLPAAEAASFALASFSLFGESLAEAGGEALNDGRRRQSSPNAPWPSIDRARHPVDETRL